MDREVVESLQAAIGAVHEQARASPLDGCDLQDIEEIIAPAVAELKQPAPNLNRLSTYLNSLARSLRAQQSARHAVLELDAAMRNAGVPTNWEH